MRVYQTNVTLLYEGPTLSRFGVPGRMIDYRREYVYPNISFARLVVAYSPNSSETPSDIGPRQASQRNSLSPICSSVLATTEDCRKCFILVATVTTANSCGHCIRQSNITPVYLQSASLKSHGSIYCRSLNYSNSRVT